MRTVVLSLLALIMAIPCQAQIIRGRNSLHYPGQIAPSQAYQPYYQPRPVVTVPSFHPDRKVDGASGYNVGRMPELPQGEDKLVCWIVLSDRWQHNELERSIAQAVTSDPRMQKIKQGTQFNYYVASNPLFADSPLVGAVGTATPIMVLTAPDGRIMSDGTAGLFVNAKTCPKTAAGCVDMLCDAIEKFNPPPVVEGQTKNTPLIRETSFFGPTGGLGNTLSIVEQCTPDTCPPNQPIDISVPNDGTLTPVLPYRGPLNPGLLQTAGVAALIAVLGALGIFTPFKKQ